MSARVKTDGDDIGALADVILVLVFSLLVLDYLSARGELDRSVIGPDVVVFVFSKKDPESDFRAQGFVLVASNGERTVLPLEDGMDSALKRYGLWQRGDDRGVEFNCKGRSFSVWFDRRGVLQHECHTTRAD